MNFNKTSLGVGGELPGELPEWSKVNYLESEEVGVDQKKSREEETGNNFFKEKQVQHGM